MDQYNRISAISWAQLTIQLGEDRVRAFEQDPGRLFALADQLVAEQQSRVIARPLSDVEAIHELTLAGVLSAKDAEGRILRLRKYLRDKRLGGHLAWRTKPGYGVEHLRACPHWDQESRPLNRLYNADSTCDGVVIWNPHLLVRLTDFNRASNLDMPYLGSNYTAFAIPSPFLLMALIEAALKVTARVPDVNLVTSAHTGAVSGETYCLEYLPGHSTKYYGQLEELDAPGIQLNLYVSPVIVVPFKDR